MHSFSFHMNPFMEIKYSRKYVNETLLNDNQIILAMQLTTILKTQYLINSEEEFQPMPR